jgi:hypothetical protein
VYNAGDEGAPNAFVMRSSIVVKACVTPGVESLEGYKVPFTAKRMVRLNALFAGGMCDLSTPVMRFVF